MKRRIDNINKYYEDLDRLAEALNADSKGRIVDRDTFDEYFDQFLEDTAQPSAKQKKVLYPKVFEKYRELYPHVSPNREFKQAGGKDLHRDMKQDARHIVKTRKEYRKRGSARVDLKDFDTKQRKTTKDIQRYGYVKNKVVRIRLTYVYVNNKRQVRYRDTKGRFARLKR